MKTYHFAGTKADLPSILEAPELQFQTIVDVRFVNQYDPEAMPRVEVDAYDNPEGQVILPTVRERLEAAELLLSLLLEDPLGGAI